MFPEKLTNKLRIRSEKDALRELKVQNELIDFSSNDYLGFAQSEDIFKKAIQLTERVPLNGATGSRLLSGNHLLYQQLEANLCEFYQAEASLVFNSGYDANTGFFSSIPQKGDIIFYDEYIHASIRDGMQMSNAKTYKFKHNDFADLESRINRNIDRQKNSADKNTIYVVTESVFSMDGDTPDLKSLTVLCEKFNCYLIVDEAHAVGVFGKGKIQEQELENRVFARVITFGKALGSHGAAILSSEALKAYLINFARSFIYTTALPPHSIATVIAAHQKLKEEKVIVENLKKNIKFFKEQLQNLKLREYFIESNSAIQSCIIPGNENVKSIANQLQNKGFDVRPILSPTVPGGEERLRFCLHSYNSRSEIEAVLKELAIFATHK